MFISEKWFRVDFSFKYTRLQLSFWQATPSVHKEMKMHVVLLGPLT